MSEENVEITRQSYVAYNAALSAPNPREAIRAWLERFADPEVEWDAEPTAVVRKIFHGIDGVMEFFDEIQDEPRRSRRFLSRAATSNWLVGNSPPGYFLAGWITPVRSGGRRLDQRSNARPILLW